MMYIVGWLSISWCIFSSYHDDAYYTSYAFVGCISHTHHIILCAVCPDEINHEHGDITDLFINHIGGGKVFHLGGLAGVPFTGKTGFGAYSGHVGQRGHCFVLQAPVS